MILSPKKPHDALQVYDLRAGEGVDAHGDACEVFWGGIVSDFICRSEIPIEPRKTSKNHEEPSYCPKKRFLNRDR